MKKNKKALLEAKRRDRSQDAKEEDKLFNSGSGEIGSSKPVLTLKKIRLLRLEKEKSRRDLLKRMELVARMYSGGGAGAGDMGAF